MISNDFWTALILGAWLMLLALAQNQTATGDEAVKTAAMPGKGLACLSACSMLRQYPDGPWQARFRNAG